MSDLHFHRRKDDDPELLPPPQGMTAEQLEFFTEQTKRAVRKATRRDRAVNRVAYVILAIGLVVAIAIPAREQANQREAMVQSGNAVAVEGCNRDFVDRQNFRATIARLRRAARDSKTPNPEAIAFYTAVLAVNPPLDCRDAQKLLTDDPDARIPTIPPYYPGASYAPIAPTFEG